MNTEWYKDFFTGVVVETWPGCLPPEQTRREVDLIHTKLGLGEGDRVLDLPCGDGRIALELAARGCRVTGVDISGEMLELARMAARDRGLAVEWFQADMKDPLDAGPFDAAVCMGNSFGYLDADGMGQYLASLARCLRPGGGFLLDSGTVAECILPTLRDNFWYRLPGVLILFATHYAALEGRLDVDVTYIRDGREETRRFSHHVFTLAEIRGMLARAGLRVREALGSTEGEEFHLGSRYLYLISQRE